ncbi:CPBP family intramembrane glutamic endopeptidase [Pseudoxanthomonas koreensis]|uniref:CPBP family intramembrane glutamic endopeptidase n=1 Tax=Pseudoxanthomonas koreensis TaxID=266061 RepID=UPI0013915A49|nr:CPBP family intramembrane glutamic endopeptidase [Pseudoxanthomonas koreensis]KAF1689812.1 CPBP family intramembrane metalloprotease [Pseudoxanthomonas koreensis]
MSTAPSMAAAHPASIAPATTLQDLKIAAAWGVLSGLAAAALIPYVAQLMPEVFAKVPVPLAVVAAAQGAQAMVVVGLLAWLGLRMGHRVGLGSPLMHAWLVRRQRPDWARLRPVQAALLGIAAAVAILALAPLVDRALPPMLHPPATAGSGTTAFNGFLASFYGGIVEELMLRLFLMTLLLWLAARLRGRTPPAWAYWCAIVAAALLFGAGHLPAAAQVWGLEPVVVLRTLLLNGIAGVAFGWLYWKRGIEMAMLAHFSADLVLHVAAPLLAPGSMP